MKNRKLFGLSVVLLVLLSFIGFRVFEFYSLSKLDQERAKYIAFFNSHPFANRIPTGAGLSEEEMERLEAQENKTDRPDLAYEQDFLWTMDPAIGRPAPERLELVYNMLANNQKPQSANGPGGGSTMAADTWTERGPSNIGGRTRAVMFDPNDATKKKVWAGSVGGGLWFTNDITVSVPTWNKVNDVWDNLAITTIAYNLSDLNEYYVGTGEGWWNSDKIQGIAALVLSHGFSLGVWKRNLLQYQQPHLSDSFPDRRRLRRSRASVDRGYACHWRQRGH